MYLHESAATDDIFRKDEIPDRRNHESAEETVHTELPGFLALTRTRIDAGHQEDDVE